MYDNYRMPPPPRRSPPALYLTHARSPRFPGPGAAHCLTVYPPPCLRHITLHLQIGSLDAPPSVTVDPTNPDAKARYVVSSSGEHVAHPDEILSSCQTLEQHLKRSRADAENAIKAWEESIQQRELAEKRRVAPGWLDRDEKLLQPRRATASPETKAAESSLLDSSSADQSASSMPPMIPRNEGEELDRAFGGLALKEA
ncbi:hypothetical protein N7470_006330 [Penicillium chermesinum]|nr:hypothetical protein N7470_006330 [Penicillium chermesinum]